MDRAALPRMQRTTKELEERLSLSTGKTCEIVRVRNEWIPRYYLLTFPKSEGEPTPVEISEMLALGINKARELAKIVVGDPEAFGILYSGYSMRRELGWHVHIVLLGNRWRRRGSISFWVERTSYRPLASGETMLPEREGLDARRWADLMSRLGLESNLDTFERLQAAYAEKHRHYHTSEHIRQCLLKFDEVSHLAQRPAEVELALWFHDAVYATRSKKNEAKSAAWAMQFLAEGGAHPEIGQRVHDLIMATKHDAPAESPDAGLVVDIDLSILAANEEAFARFEQNVRKEYWWVPSDLFRKTRAAILQSFLDRSSVYGTAYFRQRGEAEARRNLATAIAALTGRE